MICGGRGLAGNDLFWEVLDDALDVVARDLSW
jgi:hypothetical protein